MRYLQMALTLEKVENLLSRYGIEDISTIGPYKIKNKYVITREYKLRNWDKKIKYELKEWLEMDNTKYKIIINPMIRKVKLNFLF